MELICINDNFTPEVKQWFNVLPKEGNTYTLRKRVPVMSGANSGKTGILLHEIINPPIPHPSGLGTMEPSFDESRFAPADEWNSIGAALVEEISGIEEVELV